MAEIIKSNNAMKSQDGERNGDSSSAKVNLIGIPATLSVRELADLLQVSAIDVIKRLMRKGIMANINQVIDYEMAAAVVAELGHQAHLKSRASQKPASAIGEVKKPQRLPGGKGGGLKPRPPVVTIMGHVNHGKTRLLDAIRQTNVMDTEAGGITQHIGAYQVEVKGHKITFLDTPGHEAFTAMRARGAQITDIVILVVAADDGVMPQTLEAIDHARAAGVPIVVAINKVDKPDVNLDAVKQQLADAGLLVEDWGGDVVSIAVSAKEKTGVSELLENLLLVAEMEDLKANPLQPAAGVVIEAELDKTKGPLATVLVQAGTLKVGDTIVVGATWGRVKAMFDDKGKRVRKTELADPVEILGLTAVPQVGDVLTAVAGERQAQGLIQKRQEEVKKEFRAINLGNLYDQISAGRVKELNIILKTDVQGSIEPIRTSLEQLGVEEVRVRVVHSGTGNVTESDVMLAIASKGIIVSFGTGCVTGARRLADVEGVSVRSYDVIYDVVDDVGKALRGLLEPSFVEVVEGRAEIRAVFSSGKKTKVAGAYVTEGKATIGVSVRLRRQEEVMCESVVDSLRRFKDKVKEVAAGYECGIGIEKCNDFKVGDILEFFREEEK